MHIFSRLKLDSKRSSKALFIIHSLFQEDLFDVDRVQQEQKVEIPSKEDEVFSESFADIHDSAISSNSEGFAHQDHTTVQQAMEDSVSSANSLRAHVVMMDVIKREPDINPLAKETSYKIDIEERNSISEEGNIYDLHATEIKTEYMDQSYDLKSEVTFEETSVPIDFPIVKSEAERRDLVFRCRGGPRPSDRDLGLAVALIGRGGSHLLGPGGLGHFIEKIQTLKTRPGDIMVSFDVVSLFTRVPIIETIELLKNIFPEDIVALFQLVLTTTYFQWNGDFYEQTDGVAMGSPLSPMVANFYMESFEDTTLKATTRRPECWFRYVDDTFVVWRHGEPALRDFLNHLNGVHKQIQFTMELESDGRLPFLDVLVHRKPDGTLGHSVYRKPTHTDRYLHKSSNHHPGQKRAMMKTLIERAQKIS
ncbi:hypothetical protein ANN_27544 [Periplaneta americana]|uniref:Reverse transcriptase domain-containing protein n=1 Tax=Periplaneta americana TaxID=6978 RepID=A0ABQ8RW60_PERAM|nr:hypothetical protein ANN_27544 [Periplaneta americana]